MKLRLGALALIGAIALSLTGFSIYAQTITDYHTCTVTGKDRAAGKSGSDMRVYTKDCGTFAVADSLLDGHWSSADTYAEIEEGKEHIFWTRGIRVPFLSMFPNVVKVWVKR